MSPPHPPGAGAAPPTLPDLSLTAPGARGRGWQLWTGADLRGEAVVVTVRDPDAPAPSGAAAAATHEWPESSLVPVHALALDHAPPYMVLGHLAGGCLAARPPARDEAGRAYLLEAAARVARALAHLHEQGAAHGDVRAASVWLDAQGRAALAPPGLPPPTGERGRAGEAAPPDEEPTPEGDVRALQAMVRDLWGPGAPPEVERILGEPTRAEALARDLEQALTTQVRASASGIHAREPAPPEAAPWTRALVVGLGLGLLAAGLRSSTRALRPVAPVEVLRAPPPTHSLGPAVPREVRPYALLPGPRGRFWLGHGPRQGDQAEWWIAGLPEDGGAARWAVVILADDPSSPRLKDLGIDEGRLNLRVEPSRGPALAMKVDHEGRVEAAALDAATRAPAEPTLRLAQGRRLRLATSGWTRARWASQPDRTYLLGPGPRRLPVPPSAGPWTLDLDGAPHPVDLRPALDELAADLEALGLEPAWDADLVEALDRQRPDLAPALPTPWLVARDWLGELVEGLEDEARARRLWNAHQVWEPRLQLSASIRGQPLEDLPLDRVGGRVRRLYPAPEDLPGPGPGPGEVATATTVGGFTRPLPVSLAPERLFQMGLPAASNPASGPALAVRFPWPEVPRDGALVLEVTNVLPRAVALRVRTVGADPFEVWVWPDRPGVRRSGKEASRTRVHLPRRLAPTPDQKVEVQALELVRPSVRRTRMTRLRVLAAR